MSLPSVNGPRPVLAADLLDRLRARLSASPALSWLEPELTEIGLDWAVIRLPYRPELTNGSGTVHGGILATLADTADYIHGWYVDRKLTRRKRARFQDEMTRAYEATAGQFTPTGGSS